MTDIRPVQIKTEVKTITNSTYTIQVSDINGYVRCNNATGITITCPNVSGWGMVMLNNIGDGDVTISAGTLITDTDVLPSGSAAILLNTGNDEWGLFIGGGASGGASGGEYTNWSVSDISASSYDSQSYDCSAEVDFAYGVNVSPDGTKLMIFDANGEYTRQYTMSTAWDVSSASYDGELINSNPKDINGQASRFSSSGTYMYFIGNGDYIYRYTLDVDWDITDFTDDGVGKRFYVGSQVSSPKDLALSQDGTKLFVLDGGDDDIHEYDLSTAWDVSTATYSSVAFSTTSEDTNPTSMFFNPEGTQLFVLGDSGNSLRQYSLSTGFDLSTASYDSLSFSVGSQTGGPQSVCFSADGKYFYVANGSGAIYRYSTDLA